MSIFSAVRSRSSRQEVNPPKAEIILFDQLPADKKALVEDITRKKLGITMEFGLLLNAVRGATTAVVAQREQLDQDLAQRVIDDNIKDLGYSRAMLSKCGDNHEQASQLHLSEIRNAVDAAYQPATEVQAVQDRVNQVA